MKKAFSAILLSTLLIGSVKAQFNCLSHDFYSELMQSDSMFRKNQFILEAETEQLLLNKSHASSAATYVIPVVFHVIYTTQAGNISDAQILDQMDILNKEFRRQQADTILTPAAFLPFAAPLDIEFRLATIDPAGNCTNGINRIYSSLSNCSYTNNAVKALSYWPSNKYLNIWVVQSMRYNTTAACDGGGYAQFPGGAPNTDGINIRGDVLSSIGTATNSSWGNFLGRYLIHELGHWLNLRHIWGDATCGNDLVADTPPHVFSNSGCPNFPHNPNSSCAGSNANGEMFTNYMDYTNGPCLNMFTAGQVARMTAALNSAVSGRNNLWSNQNRIATGTADPYVYPAPCVSVPDVFPFDPITTCVGDSVKISDKSYGGITGSRLWSVPGGQAASLTDSTIYVKYAAPGLYNISLTNTYLSSSKSSTFTNKVLVLNNVPNTNYAFPFNEDFENPVKFANDWTIRNLDNDATTWEWTQSTSFSGASCLGLVNFNKQAPLIDELITPEYDLTAIQNPTLTFQLHFAGRVTNNNDRLQVFISNNCGKTWNSIYQKSANASLRTTSVNITSSYTPAVASSEWRKEQANLLNTWAGGKVNFKFVFTSGAGNNIFIDDINIDGINTTGLNEQKLIQQLLIYPNPANDVVYLECILPEGGETKIEVIDVLGKTQLQQSFIATAMTKENKTINLAGLPMGTYMLTVTQKGVVIRSSKVIKYTK
ncbi:MAG: M43 family zinc metalloprotease [Bacteroidia bacterium]|nr:M43 family zinc metalloprotease [Bacteroidia bacterium]